MKRPVRVLLLIDSLSPEAGTENQVVEMVRRMSRDEVELFVACMEDGVRLRALAPLATTLVYPASSVFSLNGLKQLLKLRRDIRRLSIDVVHTFMIRATIFGVLGSMGSRAAVLTSRRNLGYWYTPGLLRLFRFLNIFTTRVLANSKGARQVAMQAEGLSAKRIDVIYNGVDMHRFGGDPDPLLRTRLGIPANAPVVGIVANYRPVKNLAMFVQASQLVAQHCPDAVFLMVGRGPLQTELQQQAQSLGIADRVFFSADLGHIAAFYPLLRIGCLTSHSEGFSNAVLEYMAAGLPVVATDVGGIGEALDHGTTGLLVPAGNATAFAEAIIALLQDPKTCTAMGQRGRQYCAEHFELGHIVRQYESYYQQDFRGSATTGRR